MNVSIKYLKEYLDLGTMSYQELATKITVAKIEIEQIHVLAQGDHLIIGYVEEAKMHPKSSHLHVCKVNIGNETIQIVCGAPNVDQGQKVIVALPGANLPAKGVTIKESIILEEPSQGMICSLLELGVDEKYLSQEQKDGIEVLDDDAVIGDGNPLAYLGLDDVVFELKPTPDRGDALSLQSFVYEVSAVLNLPLKKDFKVSQRVKEHPTLFTCTSNTSKCPAFYIKAVRGIQVKPSPRWLQQLLHASGIRSLNNIVDIGNYVMLVTGQPLHMYDADLLPSREFIVTDNITTSFQALDGFSYQVLSDDLVVSCGGGAVSLAGIMGAANSSIRDTTKHVAIEAASFDGVSIRKTSRRLQLISDSSTRFVRGTDRNRMEEALRLACQLLIEYGEAKIIEETAKFDTLDHSLLRLPCRLSRINQLLGTSFTMQEVESVFQRLHFAYLVQGEVFEVEVPSYRPDITVEQDLIEEVIRLLGFDRLPMTYPITESSGSLSEIQQKRRMIRSHLTGQGLYEALSYGLETPKFATDFTVLSDHKNKETIRLMMPMSEERSTLRQSVIPSLLEAVSYNQARNIDDVALFEMSNLYPLGSELEHLGIALSGTLSAAKWKKPQSVDFYTVKGLVQSLLQRLGIDPARYSLTRVEPDNSYYHPGRSVYLVNGRQVFGVIGQIHPQMERKYDVKPTIVAELDLNYLLALKTSRTKFIAPSLYPAIRRDLAIVIDEHVEVGNIIKTIKKVGKLLVTSVDVFDVYQGDHVAIGMKSVAISILYQDVKKTLVDQEVSSLHQTILESLKKEFNAELRS